MVLVTNKVLLKLKKDTSSTEKGIILRKNDTMLSNDIKKEKCVNIWYDK